jgi:argininosuccinate lyase
VGKAVALAIETKTPLDKIDLTAISEHYGNDTTEIFQLKRALDARTNPGCPNPRIVREQIARWQKLLSV